MTTLIDKIRSRGHWQVVIHPSDFVEMRVKNILELKPLLEGISVNLRGWDFPHMDPHVEPHIDRDWVGQETDWEHYVELWQLYQSGQLVHVGGLVEDWLDQSQLTAPPRGWAQGGLLSVTSAVFRFTEIFELAARLSETAAGGHVMHIDTSITGIEGRQLWVDESKRMPFGRDYRASADQYRLEGDFSRTHLLKEGPRSALEWAQELFRRFGWDPSILILQNMQDRLLTRQ